ncbi:uncharacterized protein K452DRAFT_283197 [Aplosporella prunicola CBS 121167]|uniref:Uncharacterized protein n=1 Tax=Aplosporella prunicola CBS 121167 TaxID=1176127 RepID=A0A6A6BP33_9PEZI|nr:uncharacterized protein K452DRAFT_283197 [Aplosporella prunicola CBS 121167]KAF2145899.1 hypothetical protein K452DRAFT_283197 [Aplosporella prunicola CBS 121167]
MQARNKQADRHDQTDATVSSAAATQRLKPPPGKNPVAWEQGNSKRTHSTRHSPS